MIGSSCYWKQLKKLEGSKDDSKYIPDYTLISHFREILKDDHIKLKYDTGAQGEKSLDYDITEEELQKGSKVLKHEKAWCLARLFRVPGGA